MLNRILAWTRSAAGTRPSGEPATAPDGESSRTGPGGPEAAVPLPEVDPADVVEQEEPLPENLPVPTLPLNRRSPFYLGFFGALGVLVAWQLVQVLGELSQELTFVLIAIFLALGLNPLVERLVHRGFGRGWAVFFVFCGLVLVFALIGFLVIPPIVAQARDLVDQAPHLLDDLRRDPQIRRLDGKYHLIERGQEQLQSRLTSADAASRIFGGVIGAGKAIISGVVQAVTILVLTLYFLAALPTVKASAYRLVPLSRRTRVVQLSEEISRRVGGYVIGQGVVATVNGLLCFTMLELLGLPFAPIIAVTVAFLGLIPIVGTLVGGVLVVFVALFSSWEKAVIMLIYYVAYHIFDAYILSPKVMRRAVEVPPAVTILAILAGGTLLGIVGALIAIPVAAGLLLIYEEVVVPRQQRN